MSDPSNTTQDAWVARVLGVALAPPPPTLGALRSRLDTAATAFKALLPPPAAAPGLLRAAISALQAGDGPACKAALDALEPVLRAGAAGPALSLVALGKARLAWRQDRLHAIAEIGRLQSALQAEFGAFPDQQAPLQSGLKRLDALIARLSDEMDDSLDAVLNAAEPGVRATRIAEAKAMLARFDSLIATDEIMDELDGNEVLPDMEVSAPLRKRLAEIGRILG